jgi:hypothetical protein
VDHREVREVIAAQVHPYDRNYLRHGDRLAPALAALDEAWARLRAGLGAGGDPVPTRQAAAMVLLGSYRNEIGWGRGRTPGARTALGPPLPPAHVTSATGRPTQPIKNEGVHGA